MGGTRSIHLRQPVAILPANFHRCAAAAVLGLLIAAALMVVARRLAGALANPLDPAALSAVGALVAAAAVAIRLGWLLAPIANSTRRLDRAVMIVTSLAVVALGGCLCLPGTLPVGLFMLCTLLGVEESWAWAWHVRHSAEATSPQPQRAIRLDAAHATSPRAAAAGTTSHAVLSLDPEVADLAADVTQQLTRSQAADGTESLSGWLRLPFAASQRTGSIHVAFCPPFAAAPELEVEQIDGPEARIKTAQLLSYGARLDLKLAAPAEEPTTVLLQFSARTT